eukprot:TRINITY_DN33165_c1_g2_i2.p1 TRINITY_DN33165_c1_g2~~TRINITY_DN33165_c1_g2_i2.p1  ORF type:complete len:146 (+),score=9.08 TRINITY_DN33165_c1_g2_i2:242-679(+)
MDNLKRQELYIVNACPVCFAGEESIDHLLLNCRIAQQLWRSTLDWFQVSKPLPNSLSALFEFWRLGVGFTRERILRNASFLVVIWSIWKERNRRCFEGRSSDVSILVDRVKHSVATWVSLILFSKAYISVRSFIIGRKWSSLTLS